MEGIACACWVKVITLDQAHGERWQSILSCSQVNRSLDSASPRRTRQRMSTETQAVLPYYQLRAQVIFRVLMSV